MRYHLGRNGQQSGPFTEAEVRAQLAAGTLQGTDLIWREGLTDWVPVASLISPDLAPPAPMTSPYAASGGGGAYAYPAAAGRAAPGEDYALAGRLSRLGAVMLDGLVNLIGMGPGLVWLVLSFQNPAVAAQLEGDAPDLVYLIQHLAGPLLALMLPVLVILVVQTWLLCQRGQTLGKLWLKIRIVRMDGSRVGCARMILLRSFVMQLLSAIPGVGGLIALLDVLFIFRQDRRCLHDLIADTRVVMV
jgi:uncharacterized RDD family membrane protein YckC